MTDLRAMTPQQVRDWLFVKMGGIISITHGHIWKANERFPLWFDPPFVYVRGAAKWATCPLSPTIDGAAAAMPEGWTWTRENVLMGSAMTWRARHREYHHTLREHLSVSFCDTGDEQADRYLLAALAVQKEAARA